MSAFFSIDEGPRSAALPQRGRQGFSLVELLIALGILLILTGLIAGVFTAPVEEARIQVLEANLRSVRRSIRDFYNDHGRFPYNGQDEFGNVVAFLDPTTSELVNGVHSELGKYENRRAKYLLSIPVDPTLTDPLPLWDLVAFDNDGDGQTDEDPFGNGDEDGDGQIDEDPPDVRDVRSMNPTYFSR